MFDHYEESTIFRPCLVLAHAEPAYAADTARAFRRRGWDVYLAQAGPEARRLARMLDADLVILGTDLPGESGWLTCNKLVREQPVARVLLVAPRRDPAAEKFAAFVGASALVEHAAGLPALFREVEGNPLPAAG
jgi:DNA-binding response OmpR family regulator